MGNSLSFCWKNRNRDCLYSGGLGKEKFRNDFISERQSFSKLDLFYCHGCPLRRLHVEHADSKCEGHRSWISWSAGMKMVAASHAENLVFRRGITAQFQDELRTDHDLVFLLQRSVQNQEQRTPIACRLCDKIFFDNKSLLNHFQSHFHPDGTSNQHLPTRNLKLYGTSQNRHSFPAPAIAGKIATNQNLGITTTLPFCNPVVSGSSHIPIQSRGPTFTHRHHPYQLPSISHSAFGIGPSASGPGSPLKLFSPAEPKRSDICTSRIMKESNTRFPVIPSASTLLGISQFMTYGSFSSRIPSTSLGKRPLTAIEKEPGDLIAFYTKPYIMQLDKPFEELAGAVGDEIPEELDLILKL